MKDFKLHKIVEFAPSKPKVKRPEFKAARQF
jgi:hypothetical protein